MAYREALSGSSRVHLNRRASDADDRIKPGQEYGLDFFFDYFLTWANTDGEILPCTEYSRPDIERAVRDPSFRKRPAGVTDDASCRADIRLGIEQEDTFEYREDMPLVPDGSILSLMTACTDAGYDSVRSGPGTEEEGTYY